MGRKPGMNILIIGSDKIASFKIGLEQPLRHLEKSGICKYDVRSDDQVETSRLAAADAVIFFRTVHANAYKSLELAREMGKKTIYVTDDHFMAMPPGSEMGRYYHDSTKRKTYVQFLKNADMVKVASSFFAKHLETHFSPRKVVYFPGSVDFSLLSDLEQSRKHEDKVVIGYEGGKKESAFEPVIMALRGILRKYGDKVRIEFFGYIPDKLQGKSQVAYHPHMSDYRNFVKRLYQAKWDIGLAPLDSTLLHDCKTNNKFREYGACRIPGIYSSSPAYEEWVKHKESGLLVARSRDDWFHAIEYLIEQPELRRKIADHAESVSQANFSIEACADRWRKQILLA